MIFRRTGALALLLLGACHENAPRAAEPDPGPDADGSSDGDDGADGAAADGASESGDGADPGEGDGSIGGESEQDGGVGPVEGPYLEAPELDLVSVTGQAPTLGVIDATAVVVAPFNTNVLQYTLWARVRNEGDAPLDVLGLGAEVPGADELTGVTRLAAPLCAVGDAFEPCLLPGDVAVLAATILLDRVEQASAISAVTARVLVNVLAEGTTHVPMSAELSERRSTAVGEFYDLSGVLHNDTAYGVDDVVLDVFAQAASGKIVGHHELFAGDLAPEARLALATSTRPGYAATSFLWFARGTRTP